MNLFTKEELVEKFIEIEKQGWIKNNRQGNQGAVGNTLEDLLGIEENNLPIPNASEWELKAQRKNTTSLTTLFHCEPSPRAIKFVPQILLLKYGWKHQGAGIKYPENEMSFRQTISGKSRSDRGFCVKINRNEEKILISFDSSSVSKDHSIWLNDVKIKTGLDELNPQPYWGFGDLEHKAGTKLLNCFYVQADVKKENGNEYFHFNKVVMLQTFSFEKFLNEIELGNILVDFDARTGHNHGTKFRLRQNCLPRLYETTTEII